MPNAIEQAEVVAGAMLEQVVGYTAKPWFWSDQYDTKLQIAGLNTGYDRIVTRPGAREGAQSVWYFKGARLLAVDAMNDPRAYMVGKRWIESHISPDPARIADPEADLKQMAAGRGLLAGGFSVRALRASARATLRHTCGPRPIGCARACST